MQLPNLKQTLLLDATTAAAFVILCLGLTAPLAEVTGLPASIVAAAGWICVPSALLFLHQAFRPSRVWLTMVVAGNAAWLIASLALWLAYFGELSPLGHGIVVAQAVGVEIFLMLEWRGLKALSPAATTA
jgi:hypothetical protein